MAPPPKGTGTKLTPAAHKRLNNLTVELQKTGAVLATPAAHCENYVSCKKLTKKDDPKSSKRQSGPGKVKATRRPQKKIKQLNERV
jgi:hypothetical protein